AFMDARSVGSEYIGTEHILIGILKEGDSIATRILFELDADPQKIYNEIIKMLNEQGETEEQKEQTGTGSFNSTPTLNQFGTDLTKQAREGKL
ncbi:hypothetical protein NL341_26470, partial [Klebsiella pneumoniae]|nr:hypothetical protein [Klebsiella pneumoniae]